MEKMKEYKSLVLFRRWHSAAIDSTLTVFGIWWLNTVTWNIPKTIMLVGLIFFWFVEFFSLAPIGE